MNNKLFASTALLSTGINLIGCSSPHKEESQRPNILFILSDDHTTTAISAYGSKFNKTPNIDRIANQGVLFKNAFVVCSLCAPSRASILTSQYGEESGFFRIGDTLDTTLNTLPKILQKAGYETALLGKWHLKSRPIGFDYCQAVKGQESFFDPVFLKSEEWYDEDQKRKTRGFFTDLITDRAIQWLENRRSDKPFALFVHHKAPHQPHVTPERYDSLFTQDFLLPSTFDDNLMVKLFFKKNVSVHIQNCKMPMNLIFIILLKTKQLLLI